MRELGLADPLTAPYFRWMGDIARGEPGRSFLRAEGVAETAIRRGPLTARIAIPPQYVAPCLILATIHLGVAMIIEASLGLLGAGIPTPILTWGNVLANALNSGLEPRWRRYVFPGLAITVTVLAFNPLGDGIRDMMDPRPRGSVR